MKHEPDKYLPEVTVIEFPGFIARVHHPDITPEERERRMKKIHDSAAALLRKQEELRRDS